MKTRTTTRALAAAALLALAGAPAQASWRTPRDEPLHALFRRNEEYQPQVTTDFPHLVGTDRLRAWMAPAADAPDPCTDFYEYSCAGFRKRYASYGNTDILQLMQQSNTLLIQAILNQNNSDALSHSPAEQEIFSKVRTYYRSCTNHASIDARGFSPIRDLAESIVASCDKNVPLPRMLGELQAHGVYTLFRSVFTKVEADHPSDMRLQFIPANAFEVSKDTVLHVLKDFAAAGVIDASADLERIASWVWGIERDAWNFLASLNAIAHRRKDAPSQFMSIQTLERATGLDWRAYLEPLHLRGAHKIFLWTQAEPWIQMFRFLRRFSTRDLKYYFLWRIAAAHYNKLPKEYYTRWSNEINSKIMRPAIDDFPETEQFQTNCVTETGVHMNYLSGHLFVKYAFNATQKHAASELVDNLFKAFRARLHTVDWMDGPTKHSAIAKVDNMARIVGYPDWLADPKLVAQYYEPLTFKEGTYFENAIRAQVFTDLVPSIHQLRHRNLNREGSYFGYPWQLNAFHLTDLVQVQINSGLLQRPLFSSSNPPAMNYGSVGMIIGHEITHGFDSIGSRLDQNGVERNWMTPRSRHLFYERAQCFRDQYSDYHVKLSDGTEVAVNGVQTLAENMADNGGLATAYTAWRHAFGRNRDPSVPDDQHGGMAPDQVFFVAFAQAWCSIRDDRQTRFLLKADVHSPNKFRVNGAVANNPDFARAFKCPAHAPLNRPAHKKCKLF